MYLLCHARKLEFFQTLNCVVASIFIIHPPNHMSAFLWLYSLWWCHCIPVRSKHCLPSTATCLPLQALKFFLVRSNGKRNIPQTLKHPSASTASASTLMKKLELNLKINSTCGLLFSALWQVVQFFIIALLKSLPCDPNSWPRISLEASATRYSCDSVQRQSLPGALR